MRVTERIVDELRRATAGAQVGQGVDMRDGFQIDHIDCNEDLFSVVEVRFVRRALKKGVGSAGINNEHIRKSNSWGLDFLFAFVFNLYFSIGYWPKVWRSATIYALIKGGVRNAWDTGDYRGISIIDTIAKDTLGVLYK